MSAQKGVAFGLTIFLTVGAILLVVGVIGTYLFYRKLRKQIEEAISSEMEMTVKKPTNESPRKTKNKYIKSLKKDNGEKDEENYDIPVIDLPDSHTDQSQETPGALDLTGMNAGLQSRDIDGTAHASTSKTAEQNTQHAARPQLPPRRHPQHLNSGFVTQQQGSRHCGARNPLAKTTSNHSYLEMINDDVTEDIEYTVATDRVNKVAANIASTPKNPSKPVTQHNSKQRNNLTKPVTQQHPSRHNAATPIRHMNDNVAQQQMSHHLFPRTDTVNKSRSLPMNKREQQSEKTASMGRHYYNETHVPRNQHASHAKQYYNVTQHELNRDTRADMHRENQPQIDELYLPMASSNEAYTQDETYDNQEMIDSCKNTGRPYEEEEEEHFENQEIVDAFNRLKSSQLTSDIAHMAKMYPQNTFSGETSQAVEEETFYQNCERDQVVTEDHIYGNCEEEEHIYGNDNMLSNC